MRETITTIAPRSSRRVRVWADRTAALLSLLFLAFLLPNAASGQRENRSLRVWVATLEKPLCGARGFDNWGVWLESSGSSDTTLGFRLADSVLTIEMTLRWDTSRVQLLPPYILDPIGSLFGRFASKTQGVDTLTGQLYVTVSVDPEAPRPAVGRDIPLFYMKGYVKDAEMMFGPPEGGARVQSIEMLGPLGENLSTVRFLPGFVGIGANSGEEFTGRLRMDAADLDTNVRDTLLLYAENVAGQRIRQLSFDLAADDDSVRFLAVLPPDASDRWDWQTKEIDLDSGRIAFRFETDGAIATEGLDTLPIARVLFERRSDSAFGTTMRFDSIEWNRTTSCLGTFESNEAPVLAAARRETVDTTDTTTSVVSIAETLPTGVTYRNGVFGLGRQVVEIKIFDEIGRPIAIERERGAKKGQVRVILLDSGPIFAVFLMNDGNVEYSKKYYRARE